MPAPDRLQHALDQGLDRLERTADEVASALTHGLGLALSLVGTVVLAAVAVSRGAVPLVAALVFGGSLVLLYAASTFYHAACRTRLKARLRMLDHLSILYLIAGTYTPVALAGLGGAWGWAMLAFIWTFALGGTLYKLFSKNRYTARATWIYLAMGWLLVLFARPILAALSPAVLVLLAAGGLCYTGGVYFFLRERWRFDHAAWHLFVLGGSGCHYAAVVLLVR